MTARASQAAAEESPSTERCCAVVELRRYTLRPGMRDTLITLFERELVDAQEAVGMRVIGQFRDLDDADAFTWLRGFPDMPSRAAALSAFYSGLGWKAHRDAANATMIEWSNVLLLRPARLTSGFALATPRRARTDGDIAPTSIVTATIYSLAAPADESFVELFGQTMAPILADAGTSIIASFVTEPSANTYPALPVREGHVFVWFARYANHEHYASHSAALARLLRSRRHVVDELSRHLTRPTDVWRLAPTVGSGIG